MAADPRRVKDIFLAASEAADDERAALLDRECGADAELRQRVEALLQVHDRPDGFLNRDPAAVTTDYRPALGLNPGEVFAGRFKLREKLGEGGMGVVFVADQLEPVQRRVALKVIRGGTDSDRMLARFEQERQALALMDHPNIARVLDAGVSESGRPYFVMELIKGVPLTDYCDEAKLTPRERLELFVPVCQAVQHAHQKGIIHRDLKPSNILVGLYDGRPVPKVIDFGVAKATGQRLGEHSVYTEIGSVVGTLEYMSPEQAELNNLDIDTRSDIYALGAILYQLLTGTVPLSRKELQSAGFAEMLRTIKEKEPPRPSTRLSSSQELPAVAAKRHTEPSKLSKMLRGELDWIVMKALEKDRNRRYETANGLAMDVQRHLAGEPVQAVPPSKAYRLRKAYRRNRGAVLAAGAILAALVAGGGVAAWQAVAATRAEARAVRERDDKEQERVRAATAEAEATRQRDAAVAARQEALEAVTDLTDSTVRELLVRKPSWDPAERAFLERVVARYERLAATLTDGAGAEKLRARCLTQVGRTYLALGDYDRAVAALREAADLLRGLWARSPDDPAVADQLLLSLNATEVAYARMDRTADGVRVQDEAIGLAEGALRRFPDHDDSSQTLAVLYSNRSLRPGADRTADARRAVALAEAVVARGRGGSRARANLSACLRTQTYHFAQAGDVDGTRAVVARVEELAADGDRYVEAQLGRSYLNLAAVLSRTAQQEAAIAAWRRAARLLEDTADRAPGDAQVGRDLVHCYEELAAALRRAGRADEADGYVRRAAALAEAAADRAGGDAAVGQTVDLTAALARAHLSASRADDARAAVDRLVAAGRRLLARHPGPGMADGPDARADARRQAHRFRQIADLSNQTGRWADAIDFARQLIAFTRASAAPGDRPSAEVYTLLESANWSLSVALTEAGRADEARAAWEELLRVVAWDNPDGVNDGPSHHLATTAVKLAAAGRPVDPAAVLAPGVAARKARLAADPQASETRTELRRGYRALGLVHEYAGHFVAAAEAFDQGLGLGPPAPGEGPAAPELHAQFLLGRAVCLDARGRAADADAAWQAYRADPGAQADDRWATVFRMRKLATNGQPDRAVRLADDFARRPGASGLDRYNAACICSLASASAGVPLARKELLARRAIELLGQARAAGLFDTPNALSDARADRDLDPIRDRADFRALFTDPPLEKAPPPREVK